MPVPWRISLMLVAAASLLTAAGGSAFAPTQPTASTRADAKADRLDRSTTAAIPGVMAFIDETVPSDRAALKRGLDAVGVGDIVAARAVRDGLADGTLDRHILEWTIAIRGGNRASSAEIAAAERDLRGWPGRETLLRNMERALARENAPPTAVIAALKDRSPLTAEGAIISARAHVALGDAEAARQIIGPFWRTTELDPKQETSILAEFGALIPQADHRFRMERMLYAERIKSAERVATYAQAEPLFKAWAGVLRRDKDALKLLTAVPANQRTAGFLFAECKQLRRAKQFSAAASVVGKAPKDRDALVDPDAWWVERRVLSRELMDEGKAGLAYEVVAGHSAESPANTVDAEFHAGWYALRALGDAAAATKHFSRISEIAGGPISLSRAYYWLGRSAEAGGAGDARAYYEKAAAYGTAFYGQLAAEKLGLVNIDVGAPEPNAADRANFARREAVVAIDRLEDAGHSDLADRLYRDLADQLNSPGELALLAAKAEARGNHFLALKVAKAAANRGIAIGGLSHPLGAIPEIADIGDAGQALAYAIARQESEFNVGAVSGAGARGLLQLLPGTAKDVARRSGMPYSASRLTTDAAYNAALGAAFLGEQLSRFNGSYILTFAGYNAGPRRAADWVKRYGDPRGKDLDTVIDWIERIPFTETRSYVQRVMENYQVYKMRLTGKFDIAGDLLNGRS